MNITRAAINNRVVTSTLVALAFVAGIAAYFSLPRSEDPGFTVRTALVTAALPGASPERVELLVTDELESAIEEMEQLDFVTSETRTGQTVLQVNILPEYTDVDPIWDELRDKVNGVRGDLPAETIGPFVNDDFGDVYSTVFTLTGEDFSWPELDEQAERLRARFMRVDDVAKVEVIGDQPEWIFVEYDEARLADLGLSASALGSQLANRNILGGGGEVRTGREAIALEPSGDFASVEEIAAATVRLPGGALMALRDIAEVRRGTADPIEPNVIYDGERALGVAVSMVSDGDITDLGPKLIETAADFERQLPVGMELHTVSYRAALTDESIQSFTASLVQGMVIVLLVVLFVLGLRTGLVVASIVPLTMVGSLLVMQVLGIGLDKISLAGLIISLGLLVDCAIVVAESIIVSLDEGNSPVEAASASVKELAFPLVVGVLTTVFALLPTYTADHAVAEFTAGIFETVTTALLLSWVIALTILPMLAVSFLSGKHGDGDGDGDGAEDAGEAWWHRFVPASLRARFGIGTGGADEGAAGGGGAGGGGLAQDESAFDTPFYEKYRGGLVWLMRHPLPSLGVAVGLLAVSLWAIRFVPQTFFPRKAETLFKASLDMPYGTPLERTREVVAELGAFIERELPAEVADDPGSLRLVPQTLQLEVEREGVLNYAAFVGRSAPRYNLGFAPESPRDNYAYFLLNATSYAAQDGLIARLDSFLAATFPEVTARIEKLRNGPPIDYPVEVRIVGEDVDRLAGYAQDAAAELRGVPGAINVNDDWGRRIKKLRVAVDDDRARRAGLTSRDVAVSVRTKLDGLPLTHYREGEDLIPVMMRSRGARLVGLGKLDQVDVYPQRGAGAVPLEQVADLELAFEPSKIVRRDRERTITVRAGVADDSDATPFSVQQALAARMDSISSGWPPGYRFEMGGEPETSNEARSAIGAKAPLAVLLIVLLLVTEFNSLRKPAIILLTLPFAMIGVIGGLLLTQMQLGFMAMLGIIALFGIVINNAVVLIDRINIERDEFGRPEEDAVVVASQRRFRPIVLTAATTIGGLLPLWFGGDVMFRPMAVAMIFGLLVSTVLTLGLVPMLYSLFFRLDYAGYEYDPGRRREGFAAERDAGASARGGEGASAKTVGEAA